MCQLSYREIIVAVSKTTGIGQRTVQTTLAQYKKEGTASSPNKKRINWTNLLKMSYYDKKFTIFGGDVRFQQPKLPDLKRLSFQKFALIEREDLISWRRGYLFKIRHCCAQNRPVYYLDDTWVNLTQVRHNRTWVDSTVKSTRDAFLKGLTPGQKEPSGKENAIIVMDNASYHSVKKHKIPVKSWKKPTIIGWFESKYEIIEHHTVKIDLMEKYDHYAIDEYAKEHNEIVLRLPPYHCELNPI
ncbi:DDE 3 domain-containing protein [Aphis craccivora]|uniref:DDE 3 domain-containing protein n=1 Tax=Aphis craccivora TaxID=307492 RepID=A0A6G0VJJ6_APHCR|nr:DDE 3 domain-containing protein [Aphis craccivora]